MIDCAVHLRWQDTGKVWHQTDLYRHGNDVQLVDPPQGDEPLRFRFVRKQHGFEMRLYLSPAEPMRLETLWIELPHPVKQGSKVLVHGFQSWSENGVWSTEEERKSLAPIYGPVLRFYGLDGFGDYRFIPYDDDAGEFHSHLFASIQQDSGDKVSAFLDSEKTQDFFGSTEEDLAYGVFRFRDDAVTFERDVEGMVVLPGGHLGGVAQVLRNELEPNSLPSAFDHVGGLGLCVAGVYGARGKLFDCLEEWRPLQAPGLRIYGNAADKSGIDLGTSESGWTSWYLHYNKIDQKTIMDNLASIREAGAPTLYHQIDDGYQASIGDWLRVVPGFSNGLADLSRHIKENGRQPGIWIAPFLASSKSETYREHPDWLARRRDHDTWLWDPAIKAFSSGHDKVPAPGTQRSVTRRDYEESMSTAPKPRRPRVAARLPLWKSPAFGLDILNPEVRNHIAHVLKSLVAEYGFSMIKADFLFAVGLESREGMTRAALTSLALQLLRHWTAGAKLLLCGVPIGPALGRGDYTRVGSDVGDWDDKTLAGVRFQERVSTRNSIRDSAVRVLLAGRGFKNDPDVSILRSHDTKLNETEKETLWLVNQCLGQLQFTSDDASRLQAPEKHRFISQFPLQNRSIVRWRMSGDLILIDLAVGSEHREFRLAVNTSDEDRSIPLYEGASIHARWWIPARGEEKVSDALWKSANAANFVLPPHASVLLISLHAEPEDDEICKVLWSEDHLFPGASYSGVETNTVAKAFDLNRAAVSLVVAVASGSLSKGVPDGFSDLGVRIGAWAILKRSKVIR